MYQIGSTYSDDKEFQTAQTACEKEKLTFVASVRSVVAFLPSTNRQ